MGSFQNDLDLSNKTALLQNHQPRKSCNSKFVFGVIALIVVDFIWVASSQLTRVSYFQFLLIDMCALLAIFFGNKLIS